MENELKATLIPGTGNCVKIVLALFWVFIFEYRYSLIISFNWPNSYFYSF